MIHLTPIDKPKTRLYDCLAGTRIDEAVKAAVKLASVTDTIIVFLFNAGTVRVCPGDTVEQVIKNWEKTSKTS
jgi:hypothetical protein